MDQNLIAHESPGHADSPFSDRRAAIAHHMAALEELAEPSGRVDGWTPFCRKLFLQTLAQTGRVTTACDYAALSKQSAYALRARDPLFAAGWDAACELARMPLADALYEQALDGLTETVTRDDGRTFTRHRFDSRLSIAVLNRLDRRCDRAAELGARHLGAVGQWDAFTAAVGAGDEQAAAAILETAQQRQASQLRYDDEEGPEEEEDKARLWWDDDRGEWRTNFPSPAGFDGDCKGKPGDHSYHRALTAEELDLIELECAAEDAADLAADAALRDSYFNQVKTSLAVSARSAPPAPTAQDDAPSCSPAKAGTQPAAESSADDADKSPLPAEADTNAETNIPPCSPAKAGVQPAVEGRADHADESPLSDQSP